MNKYLKQRMKLIAAMLRRQKRKAHHEHGKNPVAARKSQNGSVQY